MIKKVSAVTECKDEVKLHYERAAEDRYQRLRILTFNEAKVNHHVRFHLISTFLRKIKHAQIGIDIGTGTGVWAEVLLDYCENVIGIDFAEQNIKIARNNAVQHNMAAHLTYILGDAEELKEVNDNSFDIATHISVLQHLPDHKQALRRVNAILRKNGYLIILVHNSRCIYNRNLRLTKKRDASIAISKYQGMDEIRNLLETNGFRIQDVRLCWLFIFDFLMIGSANRMLKPLMPIRKALLVVFGNIGYLLGRFQSLNYLFREIIILAQKQ